MALSNISGRSVFHYVESNPAYSGLGRRPYPDEETVNEIEVPIARLDDIVPSERRIRFIEVDVEGGELDVLAGGLELLRRDRPVVIFEDEPEGTASYHADGPARMYDLLHGECGLSISLPARWLKDESPLAKGELEQHFQQGVSRNFIAY